MPLPPYMPHPIVDFIMLLTYGYVIDSFKVVLNDAIPILVQHNVSILV